MTNLITLIVPVHNGATYILDLIASIKGQSINDWRCIFVDDGSIDESATVIAKEISNDTRFSLIRQSNSGCGAARNTALSQVTTSFVMFADQDDLLHPQAFAIASQAIAESGDIDCLRFRHVKFSTDVAFNDINTTMTPIRATKNGLELVNGRRSSWPIFVWCHIFRTEAVKATPFPPISGGEDQAWMMELSWRNLKWAEIDAVLYYCRQNISSRSRRLSKRYIDDIFASYKWIEGRVEDYPVDRSKLANIIRHMATMFMLSAFYRSPTSGFYAAKLFGKLMANYLLFKKRLRS